MGIKYYLTIFPMQIIKKKKLDFIITVLIRKKSKYLFLLINTKKDDIRQKKLSNSH